MIAALVLVCQVHGHHLGKRELRDLKELETRRYRNRMMGGVCVAESSLLSWTSGRSTASVSAHARLPQRLQESTPAPAALSRLVLCDTGYEPQGTPASVGKRERCGICTMSVLSRSDVYSVME